MGAAHPALRVYLEIDDLQPQFAAYMATPLRARGYPPFAGEHSLIVEVAPALAIHRVAGLALKASPDLEPGILFTERQFGLLELHAEESELVKRAGEAILKGLGAKAEDQLAPETLFADIVDDLADQHAIILNRTREASMILPGQSLLLYEMTPALFAAAAANEAEKEVPEATLVDVQMIGASGRVFMAGGSGDLIRAKKRIDETLAAIKER
ncbi:MAG: microcompartment protein [Geminicoccaceae bacterium]